MDMKKMKNLFFGVLLVASLPAMAQQFNKGAFGPGEVLEYKIKYGFIDAGEAELTVDLDEKSFETPVWHVEARGKTVGTFNFFYKVRNRYDTYINPENLLPKLFTENIREGDYRRKTFANFKHNEGTVTTKKGDFKIPNDAQDVVSAFYYTRNAFPKNPVIGEKVTLNYFLSDETNPLTIEYIGKETISTELGTFNCLKFSPELTPGRVFRKDSKMYLWVTDDLNRIPLKAEVEIIIGTVYLELTDYEGLVNPMESMVKK